MYGIVLYCTVFIVLYCIVLYCIVLYCIVLYCIVSCCNVLYCIVLFRVVLYFFNFTSLWNNCSSSNFQQNVTCSGVRGAVRDVATSTLNVSSGSLSMLQENPQGIKQKVAHLKRVSSSV